MSDDTLQLRQARSRFAAMAGSYMFNTFNDNFYKQAVMLLAVAAGREVFQGLAGAAFTLPFILFAAPAGWLADRYPKRNVVIAAKATEILAACVALAGVITGHFWIMIASVALMGFLATFFSPALNGSIPELYPASHVTQANAMLRMLVTIGILAGISLAGVTLGVQGSPLFHAPRGPALVGLISVAVAAAGFLVSLAIPHHPAADPSRPFPRTGPLETLKELKAIWKDRQLSRILLSDAFVWAVGVFQILIINPLGLKQFHLSERGTSFLVAAQLLGLAGGGLLSARFAKGERWFKVLVPAGFGMTAAMLGIACVPLLPEGLRLPSLYVLIALAGLAGGLFLIPCESFLQIRPAPERKGAVWASANFASFSGMAIASGLYIPLRNTQPSLAYGFLGGAVLLYTLFLLSEFRGKAWPSRA